MSVFLEKKASTLFRREGVQSYKDFLNTYLLKVFQNIPNRKMLEGLFLFENKLLAE